MVIADRAGELAQQPQGHVGTLVAKEYVVYNNPRAATDELAEEIVRMLVRVRRHLPRKA